MVRFRGTVKGEWGEATRVGTERSGLTVYAKGVAFGVLVEMSVNPETGNDMAEVYRTGGTNRASEVTLIATLKEEAQGE